MDILVFIGCFIIIALASKQIGHMLIHTGLPLISGFLFTGIIAGPYVLELIKPEAIEKLRFVDEIALGFIAFAAGNELYLEEIKSSLKSIAWITIGLVLSTFILCGTIFFALSGFIPFMQEMSIASRIAVSVLAGTIMVARSPSSAIAVVNELRAKGPFTRTVLGVTVIMDVAVIVLFAFSSSIADGVFSGLSFEISFLGLLIIELLISLILGICLGKLLQLILFIGFPATLKSMLVLLCGYGIFIFSSFVHHFSAEKFVVAILLEPLLICMIASFFLSNYTRYRKDFSKILQSIGPPIYIAFFTLTGASLALDILLEVWVITLVLFFSRCFAIFVGSFSGGMIAGNPMKFNRLSWMSYITQAGVGLGLAREVIVEFPEWGSPFATIIISVIILNQLVGPPLFKRALKKAREAHSRASVLTEFEGIRDVVVVGLNRQSLALSHMLDSHGWNVKIGTLKVDFDRLPSTRISIHQMADLSLRELKKINASNAKAIVVMLSDEENLKICELAYENFGTDTLIVQLNNRENFDPFHELGVLVVEPGTAIVSLLDNLVRSPSTASRLLGMGKHQDVFDLIIRNPNLDGLALGQLRLPLDTVITSIHRGGRRQIAHGSIRLRVGDVVTVAGSLKSIEEVALRFDTNKEHALLHIVEKVTAKELSVKPVRKEVEKIIRQQDVIPKDQFDEVVEQSMVMDIKEKMELKEFFLAVSHELSKKLDISASSLLAMLFEREKDTSTALSPGLAVPHIIIDGEEKFCLLLVRCRQGIYFSSEAPAVPAVFVLAGSKDQRTTHLRALSAIARIALDPHFENRWQRAKNEEALRKLIVHANGERQLK
jgi:Trk K+ transport system NAD-binding subunit/mannitol/fructose-specific phosphotransferase system IIA component (Ntr-type)/Kef-type K+ transport system membrane component KefB